MQILPGTDVMNVCHPTSYWTMHKVWTCTSRIVVI